ncbi:hypothetical protein COUCH_26600 [Couchioplanes caeruleus]|uniref:hypothetical protein n=1 Tax=Couchioplanes caeruleus TaxID=56438 RepID=UPI0020BFA56E|nr:hypothetical protein [Couchioplanes caeruleus]UQU62586.1 hypothetical protein COUCH_26600 [Couchioplanes caeruleus]
MNKLMTTSAVALAAAGLITAIVTTAGGASANEAKPTGFVPAPAAVASAHQQGPLNLATAQLAYVQRGATVTASKSGTAVATITLTTATYTSSGGHLTFAVDARRPVLIDTGMFILYDVDGNENSPEPSRTVTLATGRHTLELSYRGTARPEAVGWAPADGSAVWVRAAGKPLDLAAEQLAYVKRGATVTAAKKGAVVATITLSSAKYTASGAHVTFAVDARQPVLVDTGMFIVYDANGNENAPEQSRAVKLTTGRHTLELTYRDTTARPEAIGWAPSDGDAVWAR